MSMCVQLYMYARGACLIVCICVVFVVHMCVHLW